MANKINIYSQSIKDFVSEHETNPTLKTLGNTYFGLLESGNYKDPDKLMKNFINEGVNSDISESEKENLLNTFKFITLKDLGVQESYDRIVNETNLYNEPIYKERLEAVSNLLKENRGDYNIIEDSLAIFKTLTADDVVSEEIQKLQENYQKNEDDIRVLNMISYLQNSSDYKKYKKTYDECIEALKSYNLKPCAQTRMEAVECLKSVGYDSVIKDFIGYLVALNFSDDTYASNTDHTGTMATGRTYEGGFLERWNTGKEASGLGKVVSESLKDAQNLKKHLPQRKVLSLLVERLNSLDESELTPADKKCKEDIERVYSTYDLGLNETVKKLNTHSPIVNSTSFKKFSRFVNEKINEGLPDRKFIHTAYNLLEPLNFDSKVIVQMNTLNENFEKRKERILVENTIDYIKDNDNLGLYEGLKNDLNHYLSSPSAVLKNRILEQYSNVTKHDSNISQFFNAMKGIKDRSIVNSNPKDFKIDKVYSVYERIDDVDHFIVDGNYLIKKGNQMAVINENDEKVSTKLLNAHKLLEAFDMKVVADNHISGRYSGEKIDIKLNEDNKSEVYVNNTLFNEEKMYEFKLLYENIDGSNHNGLKYILQLNENVNLLTEMDFVHTITYKKDPKVRVNLFNLDGMKYINYINENISLNKFSKTSKYLTLKEALIEYIGFDISESFADELNLEYDSIDTLKRQATIKLEEIRESEEQLNKLERVVESLSDDMRDQGIDIAQQFSKELEILKKDYRETIAELEKVSS